MIGEILLWIYCLGNFLTYLVSNDTKQRAEASGLARFFGWVSVSCLLATLLNPYGVRLHLHIIQSFLTSSGWLHSITEHGSPDFHMGVVRCFEALLLAGLVVFSVSWKRLTFIELGLLTFWTHMGLYSVRHIPLYVLVVVPILVRHCTIVLEGGETDQKAQSWIQKVAAGINRYSQNLMQIERRFDTASYAKVAVLVMIGLCLNGGRLGGHQLLDFHFDENRFPIKSLRVCRAGESQGQPLYERFVGRISDLQKSWALQGILRWTERHVRRELREGILGCGCPEFQLERCAGKVSHCLDSGACGFEPVDRPGGIPRMGVSL